MTTTTASSHSRQPRLVVSFRRKVWCKIALSRWRARIGSKHQAPAGAELFLDGPGFRAWILRSVIARNTVNRGEDDIFSEESWWSGLM